MKLFTITRGGWDKAVQPWPGFQSAAALAAKGGSDRAVGISLIVPW